MTAVPQHEEARAKANRVRSERAALRRSLAKGEARVRDVIREGVPDCLNSMPIWRLLCSERQLGPRRSGRLLAAVPIKPGSRVGELTERQRLTLAMVLADWEKARR